VTREPYANSTIEAYLERLASAEPEPGGGSAAALVGALAAALVSMVTNLTLGKEKYALAHDAMAGLKVNAEFARTRLSELITLDARAYGAVAQAMKLPQDSDEEKRSRTAALQKALRGAAEVPLTVAEVAAEVARLSLPAAELGNLNAVSDAAVAAVLADAAAQAAALNVKINLAWIKDKDYARDAWSRVEAVLSETAQLRDAVLSITYSKL
jgi:formiminotetrahydrofolate cyclodeaminase